MPVKTAHRSCSSAPLARSRQRGVVLLVALIVLIALTLAGLALIRSVDTTNLIAGNMSFHESAVHAGERSTELAVTNWLQPNNQTAAGKIVLYDHNAANGYRAVRADPATGVSLDVYWASLAGQTLTGATDVAGNTVSYVIHRLCDATGDPLLASCSKPPAINGPFTIGVPGPTPPPQVYYRVTARIVGPRNTVAYTQAILAL